MMIEKHARLGAHICVAEDRLRTVLATALEYQLDHPIYALFSMLIATPELQTIFL